MEGGRERGAIKSERWTIEGNNTEKIKKKLKMVRLGCCKKESTKKRKLTRSGK